jgi:hypothetical protein
MRNAYQILVEKVEGTRLLGRSRSRWGQNIKIDVSEIRSEALDWIQLINDRNQWRALLNTVMNLWIP